MGLVELGRHTDLLPAMLSKLERSQIFPTLPTLLRIAMVFNLGLAYFFIDDSRRVFSVARRRERRRFPETRDASDPSYKFECLDFGGPSANSAYYADFKPIEPGQVRAHRHEPTEFIYVMKLAISFPGEERTIEAGDAVYFDPTFAHGYRRVGAKPCSAMVVTAP